MLDLPTFKIFDQLILWPDFIGNVLGLFGLYLSVKKSIWTWVIQILSALLLGYTYFSAHLLGSTGKQIIVIITSIWGFMLWLYRNDNNHRKFIIRWATVQQKTLGLIVLITGVALCTFIFSQSPMTSHNPLLDSYIFMGSLMATIALAKKLIEFWILWLCVDIVGVPLAFINGLIVSSIVYIIYLILVLIGFIQWKKTAQ